MKDIVALLMILAIIAFVVTVLYTKFGLSVAERRALQQHRVFADRVRELAATENQLDPNSLLAFQILDETRNLDRSLTSKDYQKR